MRIGVVILPEERWPRARARWQQAEALGFAHAWTYDHLTWRSLRDSSWFGAVPTLAAAALATERIRLGTLVASPNFRHPLPFAKELMTLDDLSAGRITAGLGAGGTGWDATALGQVAWRPVERAERFAEFVNALDLILASPASEYGGRYYQATGARSLPGCLQQPRIPFVIAATGPRGFQLVARHGAGWVTTGDTSVASPLPLKDALTVVRHQLEGLDAACAAAGRDPASVARMVLSGLSIPGPSHSLESLLATIDAFEAIGISDFVLHWPRATEPYRGSEERFISVLSEVLSRA